jgi:hypothetical protein
VDWSTNESGFDYRQRQEIFVFSKPLKLALVPTQSSNKKVKKDFSSWINPPRRESDR